MEGPIAAGDATAASLAARAAWLADRLGIDAAAYTAAVREQTAGLAAAVEHDEVVLWFEQDLFCAVNLWSILDWLARHGATTRLSLVYPETDDAHGLGALLATRSAVLFDTRRPVTDAARALGRRAWSAYAGADPLACVSLMAGEDTALPFVRGALRCHLGRYPAVASGLSEVETAVLAVLRRGPRAFADLFREVSAQPRVRRHGMGDLQLVACLRGLAGLVEVAGGELATAEIAISERGRAVAAGDRDRLDVAPLDTWLGGVHLRPGAPLWRWDGARGRLVAADT